MSKSKKELAFLRDLYIAGDWTARFAEIFDSNFKFSDEKSIIYINAGTGNHALELREKLAVDAELNAFSDEEELNNIAQAKADALKSKVSFSGEFPTENFDAVVADASFVRPSEISEFLDEIVDLSDRQVVFFLPTAGSFGEIFSVLWEALFDLNLSGEGTEIERLIMELPTIEKVKEMAENFGLQKVEAITKPEIFEFENGTEFVNAPLIADFLMPVWLEFLSESERGKVRDRLAQIIDDDDGSLAFRFSVKATLIVGEKKPLV